MPTDVRYQVMNGHGHPVVRLVGSLDRDGAPAVRGVLLACLVEQPEGLVVDVSQLQVTDDGALWVFAAVAAEAAEWPATRLVFCQPPPRHVAAWRGAGVTVVPTCPDAQARLGEPSGSTPVTLDLDPVVGAAREARNLLTAACARWGLSEDVADAACIVVTEMVNNVVAHARTPMTVSATRRDSGLILAVRDHSPTEPRFQGKVAPTSQGGRGLLLIDTVARRWGTTPLPGGKVVWAALDG